MQDNLSFKIFSPNNVSIINHGTGVEIKRHSLQIQHFNKLFLLKKIDPRLSPK